MYKEGLLIKYGIIFSPVSNKFYITSSIRTSTI